jgi:hypothetical protein
MPSRVALFFRPRHDKIPRADAYQKHRMRRLQLPFIIPCFSPVMEIYAGVGMTTLLEKIKVAIGGQTLLKLAEPLSKIHAKFQSVTNQHVTKTFPLKHGQACPVQTPQKYFSDHNIVKIYNNTPGIDLSTILLNKNKSTCNKMNYQSFLRGQSCPSIFQTLRLRTIR